MNLVCSLYKGSVNLTNISQTSQTVMARRSERLRIREETAAEEVRQMISEINTAIDHIICIAETCARCRTRDDGWWLHICYNCKDRICNDCLSTQSKLAEVRFDSVAMLCAVCAARDYR